MQEDHDHDSARRRRRSRAGSPRSFPGLSRPTARSVFINQQALPILNAEATEGKCTNRLRLGRDRHERRVRSSRSRPRSSRRRPDDANRRAPAGRSSGRAGHGDADRRRRPRLGVEEAASTRSSTGCVVDTGSRRTSSESEISRIGRGELSQEEAHPDVGDVLERCEQLRDETPGTSIPGHTAGASIPPASSRAGPSTVPPRPRGKLGCPQLRDLRRWRHRPPRPPVPEADLAGRNPSQRTGTRIVAVVEADDLAIATSGAYVRGDTSSTRTPACRPRACPVGDDHRPGTRHGRRECHRGLRDGHRWPRLDRATTGLRGADAPRRRPLTAHAGLRTSPLVRDQADAVQSGLRLRVGPRRRDSATTATSCRAFCRLQLIAVPWA